MNDLNVRNITLLSMGNKNCGSMSEGYFYVEEELYCDEANELFDFCNWVDEKIGGCSKHNMKVLFKAFKNPDHKALQKVANDIRDRIAEIKQMCNIK